MRGIERMVDEERYCIEILTQIGVVTTALESLAQKLLEDHANHCVANAIASGDREQAEAKTRELLDAVQRFSRTRLSSGRALHVRVGPVNGRHLDRFLIARAAPA